MILSELLFPYVQKGIYEQYKIEINKAEFQQTKKDFEGDITLVIFPLIKITKGNPSEIGLNIGNYLVENVSFVSSFNIVSGFLNIVISDNYYLQFFNSIRDQKLYGFVDNSNQNQAQIVEYSSPNTNKPLHLGHVRNNLLGYSVAEILKASGKKVIKTQIINDRGIHICKSMLAWKKFGNGQTPQNSNSKGDKLVGNFYVLFDKEYKNQINELINQGKTEDEAKKTAPLILEAQQMLQDWEAGKPEVIELWKTMNQWVYEGFEETYKNLGVDFDSYYYESQTYLLGKEIVAIELSKGEGKSVFYQKGDGSVWIDLTDEGLDEKLVLRSDGTSVYITQDIGTAIQRVIDNKKNGIDISGMVYTVGNEQDYHFKVLFLILKKLDYDWAESLYHLSYGMVELPSGKMKSREGTVVDADDLMQEMTNTAKSISEELGKLDGYSEEEKKELYKIIGLGALKYYMLKVDPKKQMMFNPEESVDFNGNTGPFIQYTYARIQSILRKADFDLNEKVLVEYLHPKEKDLIKILELFPSTIQDAAKNFSPALIANYTYDLVKTYNSFYQSVSILGEENINNKIFRVQLSKKVAEVIKSSFQLLGIEVPERM